eukprot:CAMPEP_0184704708 /NCGR_PEP_ID=MMETSP0313-20130426/32101_1 /TAXON_ID=2792 /ORGANISM="Porphyridium aerugineum, Strain SAG 1380-2" /LENGTH=41 /DNA_ID= /DNA_START= /DNA_END= /DNA_ORIENTATION=
MTLEIFFPILFLRLGDMADTSAATTPMRMRIVSAIGAETSM